MEFDENGDVNVMEIRMHVGKAKEARNKSQAGDDGQYTHAGASYVYAYFLQYCILYAMKCTYIVSYHGYK